MKNCKDCGKPRGHNDPMYARCKDCQYAKQRASYKQPKPLKRTEIKRSQKPIDHKSKTNRNTSASFSQKTKDKIKARDKVCVISGNPIEQYHHVYFGGNANRGKNRNDADQGVGLSADIHRIMHHASPKESQLARIYRAKCIVIVQEYDKKFREGERI